MKIIINTTLNPTDVLSASVIKEDTSCELNTIELSDLIAVLEFKLDHQKSVDAIASIEDGKLYYFVSASPAPSLTFSAQREV